MLIVCDYFINVGMSKKTMFITTSAEIECFFKTGIHKVTLNK